MTTPTDYGHQCSPSLDCTTHNLRCDYPDCAKGRREGIHAMKKPMTTPTCKLCGATGFGASYGGPDICPSCDCGIPPDVARLKHDLAARDAELAEWKRKAEEAARDSERYRWLRNKARLEYMNPKAMEDSRMEWNFPKLFGMTCVMTEIPIDEAVDAAIAAKGEA